MKVVILGSPDRDGQSRQYVSSYLVNDTVAIDAGCLGFCGSPEQQECVQHLFLTHSHADHIASLPTFLENVWTPTPQCPTVYGSPETLDCVRRHVFNDRIWADLVTLSEKIPPFLRLETLRPEIPVYASGLKITPAPVNHAVPTVGYIVQDQKAAVVFAGDSGPTTRVWEIARTVPNLRAVFLEASFPNRMRKVAEASMHLTPEMFCGEAAKTPPGVRIIAIHLKVRYRDEIIRELTDLNLPALEIGECERDYTF